MTKAELLAALADVPDTAEVLIHLADHETIDVSAVNIEGEKYRFPPNEGRWHSNAQIVLKPFRRLDIADDDDWPSRTAFEINREAAR